MKICKVLVVDDEAVIRNGFKNFPWDQYGCTLAGEAEDGDEGYMLARVLRPDIVLSDIKMPGLNGVEMIRKIRAEFPQTKCLLITGYDEFAYAQAAIQEGISDYVLKPIDDSVLGKALLRVGEEIQTRKEEQAHYHKISKWMEQAKPFLRAQLFRQLLDGVFLEESQAMVACEALNVLMGTCLVISVRIRIEEDDASTAALKKIQVNQFCNEAFSNCSLDLINYSELKQETYLLVYHSDITDTECTETAAIICEKIQATVQKQYHAEISFGISRAKRRLTEICKAGGEAEAALRHRFFLQGNAVVRYADLPKQSLAEWKLPKARIDMLYELVEKSDRVGIRAFFHHINTELEQQAGIDPQIIKSTLLELMLGVGRITNHPIGSDGDADNTLFYQILTCDKQGKLMDLVTEHICSMTNKNYEQNNRQLQGTINTIVCYIQKHANLELSLDLLAEEFHLSNAYLSRLIRTKTGYSFMEIMTETRMEHAKTLLETTNYRIYEIALSVGYNDVSYFIQTFRKRFGTTPTEYRAKFGLQGEKTSTK